VTARLVARGALGSTLVLLGGLVTATLPRSTPLLHSGQPSDVLLLLRPRRPGEPGAGRPHRGRSGWWRRSVRGWRAAGARPQRRTPSRAPRARSSSLPTPGRWSWRAGRCARDERGQAGW